jgi:HK97 family phage prohead protease
VIGAVFRERIEPGAFDQTLGADVRALVNHDPNLILGRTLSGTLRLSSDDHGLRYEVDPPQTSYASDLLESVRRGDVTQSSFAFRVIADEWEPAERSGELPLRRIQQVELFDVSPVTYPAYTQTSVSARASDMAQALAAPPEAPPAVDANGVIEREHLRLRVRLQEWSA